MVGAVLPVAMLLALPWSAQVQFWQVIPAIAAFGLGIPGAWQLGGTPIIFERLLPIRSRTRRAVAWLVSTGLTVGATVPLLMIYWSCWNHLLGAISLHMICMCLAMGLVARAVGVLLGRTVSSFVQGFIIVTLVIASQVLCSFLPWSAPTRPLFGVLLLGVGLIAVVDGAAILLRRERATSVAGEPAPGRSAPRERSPAGTTAPRPICSGSIAPPYPGLVQARVLAIALLNHPGFLAVSLFAFYMTYWLGGQVMGATWLMIVTFIIFGSGTVFTVTRTLSLHGMIDRRVALGTVLGALGLCMVASITVATWGWSPSAIHPREMRVFLPDARDARGDRQQSVLSLSCGFSRRPVLLPDGTTMSLDNYALRLQQHQVLPTAQFVARQMALATARDQGFMPDPRVFTYTTGAYLQEISTAPILPQLYRTQWIHRFLCLGFLVTGVLLTLALWIQRRPRPHRRGKWLSWLWSVCGPSLPLFGFGLWTWWGVIDPPQDRPIPILKDLSYPPVELTWWQQLLLQMDMHVVTTGALMAMVCMVCLLVAMRRIRSLELDPTQSGNLWQQMQAKAGQQ